MVAAPSTAFFSISLVSDASSVKAEGHVWGLSTGAHIRRIRQKPVSFKILRVRADAQTLPKVTGVMDGLKSVHDGFIFHQKFSVRTYEIGADRTVSMQTLMNHLQETGVNHLNHLGLVGDGLGSTPEMCKRNLIWVVTKMQAKVDRYPTWGDVVQVDTWIGASGKNCLHRDWIFKDYATGEILIKATGSAERNLVTLRSIVILHNWFNNYVLMNTQTRKLSKLPDEVRAELETYFLDAPYAVDEDKTKLPKVTESNASYIQPGLTPSWNDLDVNQHVNNSKYVGWILQSVPQPVVASHELASMTLEYKKECKWDNVLDSLTSVSPQGTDGLANYGEVECQHLLRLKAGAEIMRGRTKWRPKRAYGYGSLGDRQKVHKEI